MILTEINKRKSFFEGSLKKIKADTKWDDLGKIGISVRVDQLDNTILLTVEPDRWDSLRDRLPEITDRERSQIRSGGYSAISIFDTLLMKKLLTPVRNIMWMPRAYRIFDTMADFDSYNVQRIRIHFDAEERIDQVSIFLPLPVSDDKTERQDQKERKEIVARYIATTIYNYVVTLGIYSASVDCASLSGPRQLYGFSNTELKELISKISRQYGYEQQYGKYIETYNFHKFSIGEDPKTCLPVRFESEDTRCGSFLGIDIGATDTKACLFQNGMPASSRSSIVSFPTVCAQPSRSHIPVEVFCDRIISEIEDELRSRSGKSFSWQNIDGIGISWPGAVRNSRIVAFSRTLGRLSFDSGGLQVVIKPDSPANEIHFVDLATVFREVLRERCPDIPDSFVVSIENDGNAEAYGNYCLLRRKRSSLPQGALIIKLGTSLAGGYINLHGAISQHVAEFSKIILYLNTAGKSTEIHGLARDFVSSKGVRELTRTFTFNGRNPFGYLSCTGCEYPLNYSDTSDFRVESIEIGELLALFGLISDEEAKNAFLDKLVVSDNRGVHRSHGILLDILCWALASNSDMHRSLKNYVASRGREQFNRLKSKGVNVSEDSATLWQLGLGRTFALLELPPIGKRTRIGSIPSSFDYHALSCKILSSVALFSELGLRIAHLIVALYNIYRKERFSEVVLAGGVLRGASGPLVVRQTAAFLAKYYDKVFGPTKHLGAAAVRLAVTVDDPDTVAPFGAAMVANRAHKIRSLAVMEKDVEQIVDRLKPGQDISTKALVGLFSGSRVTQEDIHRYLRTLISKSVIVQRDECSFVKTVDTR